VGRPSYFCLSVHSVYLLSIQCIYPSGVFIHPVQVQVFVQAQAPHVSSWPHQWVAPLATPAPVATRTDGSNKRSLSEVHLAPAQRAGQWPRLLAAAPQSHNQPLTGHLGTNNNNKALVGANQQAARWSGVPIALSKQVRASATMLVLFSLFVMIGWCYCGCWLV
jgi:hypothetical protein